MRLIRHGRPEPERRRSADAFHAAPQQVAAAWWDGLGSEAPTALPLIHAARAGELASAPASATVDRHAA